MQARHPDARGDLESHRQERAVILSLLQQLFWTHAAWLQSKYRMAVRRLGLDGVPADAAPAGCW